MPGTSSQKYMQQRCGLEVETWYGGLYELEFAGRVDENLFTRRTTFQDVSAVTIGGLALDPATHRVSWEGEPLKLGPTEFKLLTFFMKHPERVHSRAQLLDKVPWWRQPLAGYCAPMCPPDRQLPRAWRLQ